MLADSLKSVIGPIIVFGVVIFVHELGHFMAAKLTGVYAPRFSIGFGPALWKHRWGETEYVLALLPLGGYVRMASREDAATDFLEGGSEEDVAEARKESDDWDPNAMMPFGPRPVPANRWFESKSLPARLLIMVAGVTMNVLLTLVISIGLARHYGLNTVPTRVVGDVQSPTIAPHLPSALRSGDTILAVSGTPVRNWNAVQREIVRAPGDSLSFRTQRGVVQVPAGRPDDIGREEIADAISPQWPAVLDSVLPGQPAARAGLRPGDSVAAVDSTPHRTWPQPVDVVSGAPGKTIVFHVLRHGAPVAIAVRPESTKANDPVTGQEKTIGRIGAMPRDIAQHQDLSLGAAVAVGWKATWSLAGAIVEVVRQLVGRQVSVRQLGGPVAIAKASAAAARAGVAQLLYLLALISVNLAVLNLLPIPVLDGGQILINIAEAVKGSAFSPRTREYILGAGLVAIALLFVLVMFNDLKLWKLFG